MIEERSKWLLFNRKCGKGTVRHDSESLKRQYLLEALFFSQSKCRNSMEFLVPLRLSWHVPCLLDGLIVVLGVQAIRGAQLFGDLKFLGIPRHGNPT